MFRQTYVNDMNRHVQEQLKHSNPFEFKFIQSLKVTHLSLDLASSSASESLAF
jgi:hypothetical protein